MPTKIRLQRHGKKRYAFYHVVVADNRAPRDGKFIEKLGTYNPNTNPATIDIDFDKALTWVKTGAQPTDTVRALLAYTGVLHKHHLDRGVLKGALTQEQADKKFEDWLKEKQAKVEAKKAGLSKEEAAKEKARFEAEQEANKKKAAEVLAKTSPLAEEAPAEEKAEVSEAKTNEEPKAEAAPVEETKAEAAPPTEEKKEEPKAEEAAPAEEKKEDK